MNRSLAALAFGLLSVPCMAAGPRVVDEGGIRDRWRLADGVAIASPEPPRAATQGARNVCIALAYTIKPDGTTSDFRVLKQWNNQTGKKEPFDGFWEDFAHAGATAVQQWRFAPLPGVGQPAPTTTVATLTWQAIPGSDAAQLRAQCRIEDLAAFLAGQHRKSLTNHQIDIDNRQRDMELRRRAGTPKDKPTIRQ
jgi:hypothetical protein